jgi:hypothetical protein
MIEEAIEKKVQERLNILLTDPQLFSVYQKFGGAIFRRSSIYHGLDKFLRQQEVSGDTCFEIGSWNGLTAVILSRYFRRVVSVDIAHNLVKRDVTKFLGIDNIEFIDIEDNAHKAKVAHKLKFDFAYLDGDHANDTQDDWALCKKAGRVLFHEAWEHQPPVWHLLMSLDPKAVKWGGDGLALWRG